MRLVPVQMAQGSRRVIEPVSPPRPAGDTPYQGPERRGLKNRRRGDRMPERRRGGRPVQPVETIAVPLVSGFAAQLIAQRTEFGEGATARQEKLGRYGAAPEGEVVTGLSPLDKRA